ncbi:MAG: hypothetical protein RLZZ555_200 [Pseudomonadota bacterium]|jgi:hypothetical protein
MTSEGIARCLLFVAAMAQLDIPAWAADFACDVRHDGSKPSILLVSAADRGHALLIAARARIGNVPGGLPVSEVRECILRHREKFVDPQANQTLQRTPL